MLLVHKIQLKPNKKQTEFFQQSAGVSRFAYNWALGEWQKQYKDGDKPSEAKLRKQLNSIKKEQFPWMLDVSKTVPQQAIKNVGTAYTNFFRRVKNGGKPGFPRFKKRGISKESFKPDNGSLEGQDALYTKDKKVKIPRLGLVKLAEKLRFEGRITGSIISKTANRWFIAISVDTNDLPHVRESQGSCGIDVGVAWLAALDNGTKYMPAKALKRFEKSLRRTQRSHARKVRGSSNRRKAAMRVAKLHYKITCTRSDTIHKATTDIVLNNDFIAMETLNVSGMVKNHNLAKAISDAAMSEFQRQIIYKSKLYGSKVHKIDRWFPSTKLCMSCCELQDMPLSKRMFTCSCGAPDIDRDVHAAQNIIGQALTELTPVETKALAQDHLSETIVFEAGTDNIILY